jgi:hypothetical protein
VRKRKIPWKIQEKAVKIISEREEPICGGEYKT